MIMAASSSRRDSTKASASTPANHAGKRKRLPAEQRRHLILQAARQAFSKTGDMNGTTIKVIAAQAQISEGVIYRHFESKDELFFEAIVEPLRSAVASVVEEVSDFDPASFTSGDLDEMTMRFWATMIRSMEKILPLLGLVLFGETDRARKFYRGSFTDAVDELADTWQSIYDHHEVDYPSRVVALSSIGVALAFALDARYNREHDLDALAGSLVELTQRGFWPHLD
jgi:AcrR family transcriptional regulator